MLFLATPPPSNFSANHKIATHPPLEGEGLRGRGASDAQNIEIKVTFVSVAASPPTAVSQNGRSGKNSIPRARGSEVAGIPYNRGTAAFSAGIYLLSIAPLFRRRACEAAKRGKGAGKPCKGVPANKKRSVVLQRLTPLSDNLSGTTRVPPI